MTNSDNDRTVRIIGTRVYATFTQRGADSQTGFIRKNGKTISGYRIDFGTEMVFDPQGRNELVALGL